VPPFALKDSVAKSGQSLNLTERQCHVLALMAQGLSNKAIARALDITESTVKTHSSAILKAFDVDNQVKASHEAIRLGIVEAP
jgi:DNA-binding NarL/FixJ family response regulator